MNSRRPPFITVGYWLLGVLLLAAFSITIGKRESETFPSSDSYDPSGTAAFAELLRRSGFNVRVDRKNRPDIHADDTVIAFTLDEELPNLARPDHRVKRDRSRDSQEMFAALLRGHLMAGGGIILLPIGHDFQTISARMASATTTAVKRSVTGATLKIRENPVPQGNLNAAANTSSLSLWSTARYPVVKLSKVENGYVGVFDDGMIATNRFLNQEQNADLLLDVVRTVAGGSKSVILTEASFGNAESESVLDYIGDWSKGAWAQLLFLAAVVVYTLGRPFGLPDRIRRKQRGAREMVDAVAGTFQRGKMVLPSIQWTLRDADIQIRRFLRLPRDADRSRRDSLLPESLKHALANLEASAAVKTAPDDAVGLIRAVEHELNLFLNGTELPQRRFAERQ